MVTIFVLLTLKFYYLKMNKIPHLEINCIPSQLNTSAPTGVAAQLAAAAQTPPQYDGVSIEQMRGNPLFDRIDKIDKIGRAQKTLADNAKIVKSRSRFIRDLNDKAQKLSKPKNFN